jgi:pimeloyl-ACP methyl ester carboxylesterase
MADGEALVLVHGLWLHGTLMTPLRLRLERRGYRARAYSYPSLRLTLTENAARLARYCAQLGAPRLHLVGHSLGGLVILRMLERGLWTAPGRVVLAGTPYAGSAAAERLRRWPGGAAALGRSLGEWLRQPCAADFGEREIGVIAGNVGLGMGSIFAPGLPRPHDGAVSVAETAVPGMRDRIVLPVNHSGMLVSAAVAREIDAFLRHGAFSRAARRVAA